MYIYIREYTPFSSLINNSVVEDLTQIHLKGRFHINEDMEEIEKE